MSVRDKENCTCLRAVSGCIVDSRCEALIVERLSCDELRPAAAAQRNAGVWGRERQCVCVCVKDILVNDKVKRPRESTGKGKLRVGMYK
jgi:hypothetical protein